MRIMTFNLLCSKFTEERRTRAAAAIRKYMPDLLGVQEATPEWMAFLRTALPEYHDIGCGRDGGDMGEYNAIFAKKGCFSVLASGTRWLTDTPDTVSRIPGGVCNRICTWAELDGEDGHFYYVNTHLAYTSEEHRMAQARYLFDFLDTLSLPVILTGDMNTQEGGSDTYRYLTDRLDDTKFLAKNVHSAPTFHGYEGLNQIIDYCFISKGAFGITEYKVIDERFSGEHPSDHNPVLVTLAL